MTYLSCIHTPDHHTPPPQATRGGERPPQTTTTGHRGGEGRKSRQPQREERPWPSPGGGGLRRCTISKNRKIIYIYIHTHYKQYCLNGTNGTWFFGHPILLQDARASRQPDEAAVSRFQLSFLMLDRRKLSAWDFAVWRCAFAWPSNVKDIWGFPTLGLPPNHPFSWDFPLETVILGRPHCRKHPYGPDCWWGF